MSRMMLCGLVPWLVLGSVASCRADDAEDKAIAFVEKLKGSVTRGNMLPGQPIVRAYLSDTNVTDEGLKEHAPLTRLSILDLSQTGITDKGLKKLANLSDLCKLSLSDTRVTAAGVKEFQKVLPKCETRK